MSGKLTLYYLGASMPARAVLLLIRYLGIDVDLKVVNLGAGEQYSSEFKKLNPVAKIPVIVDSDGFVLSESRAILAYLVNTRKPGSDLYPNDPKQRALIDQKLNYDLSEVFSAIRAMVVPIYFHGAKEATQIQKDDAKKFMYMLEIFLSTDEYFAGSKLTIADFSILPAVTSMKEFNFDFTGYPKLSAWYNKMQKLPGFDENLEGAKALAGAIIEKTGKNFF